MGENMRVIAGSAKRISLKTPEGLKTRPTTDRIKETLFSMIQFDLIQCNFLDLFSGSGSIGIEALSRGAEKCTFVERDKEALQCIQENLKKTDLADRSKVLAKNVEEALTTLEPQSYHIIFMDPPYANEEVTKTLDCIWENDVLAEDGYIIVEHGSDTVVKTSKFNIMKTKEFRTTTMTFLQRM